MSERGQIIQIIPAQPGGFVITKNEDNKQNKYPLICWALVDHDDSERKIPFRRMYGCFYLSAGAGDLFLVSEIGNNEMLEGERFHDYES